MVTYPGHLIVFIYNSEIFCADKNYFTTIIGPVYTHVFSIQYLIQISRSNLMINIFTINRTMSTRYPVHFDLIVMSRCNFNF